MNFKIFVFKIILIFNFVIVHSISCKSLEKPGKYKVGEYIFEINQVRNILDVYYSGKMVNYVDSYYLESKDGSETIKKISIIFCFLNHEGSFIQFADFEHHDPEFIEITHLSLTRLK